MMELEIGSECISTDLYYAFHFQNGISPMQTLAELLYNALHILAVQGTSVYSDPRLQLS